MSTHSNFSIEPETLEQWHAAWDARQHEYPAFVAESGEAVVGFARSGPWLGRCAYARTCETSVYVDPAHHRRGVGRALYAALLAEIDTRGFRSAIDGIALPNEASVALHESLG